jgi:hypothetical protein
LWDWVERRNPPVTKFLVDGRLKGLGVLPGGGEVSMEGRLVAWSLVHQIGAVDQSVNPEFQRERRDVVPQDDQDGAGFES